MSLIRVAHVALSGEGDELEVGRGLRLTFETYDSTKPGFGKPSIVQVFNLSQETIARIQEGMTARLIAGYDDDHGLTDEGSVTRSRTYTQARERVTELQIQPAAQIAASSAKFMAEYPEGPVRLRQIVQDCLAALGATAASLDAIPDVTVEDFNTSGAAKNVLRKVLEGRGVSWAQRLGEVVFYPDGESVPGSTTHQVNERTGLIGSPSHSEQGATAMVHFDRTILVGDEVQLESRDLSGTFKVVQLAHRGDTFGTEAWSSRLEMAAPGGDA